MNIIGGQLGGISQQLRGLQAQAGAVGQNMTRALGFHELERFGRAGMDAFGGMINRAADLQMAMTKVRIATSSTESGMKSLGEIIIGPAENAAKILGQETTEFLGCRCGDGFHATPPRPAPILTFPGETRSRKASRAAVSGEGRPRS